ncbi:hypothetical protein D869_gp150 [Caulobacter phage CcrRogue]|uniref:Uncharacterized protein n=1 Tax=Caulobacter phage CcrRogue TaxID=2927986 RepID=K4JNF6_9CAUD|nr:hypothetical protein D869_gp150 [Caulobacter phage CcrRogue]AFU86764.1 hypothetical protein CcrRogue_gp282 [Caulobacter phage CcrRogue]
MGLSMTKFRTHRTDMKTVTVPGLGEFQAGCNSSCATFVVSVRFCPEGADEPLWGQRSFEPIFAPDGSFDVEPSKVFPAHRREVWPQAAEDVARTLAETVYLYDPTGFVWLMFEMCLRDRTEHVRAVRRAQESVDMLERLLADPKAPMTESYREPETGELRDRQMTLEARASRRLGWERGVRLGKRQLAELNSVESLRALHRKYDAERYMRLVFFSAPRRAPPLAEINHAVMALLAGVDL